MKLCRGCMADTKSNLQPLVATDELFDLFNEITRLNIYLNDGLPNWLCSRCVQRLEKFKAFRELCANSSRELKLKLSKSIDEPFESEMSTVFVDPKEIKVEDKCGSTISRREMEIDENVRIKTEPVDPTNPIFIKVRKTKNMATNEQKTKYQKNQAFAYQCNTCGRGFHYFERYEGHLREHEGKATAICEFCYGEYTGWSGLQKHMALMHESEMKYVCDYCGKKFIYESGLVAHRSTHYGPRKHVCEECGRSFTNTYSLSKHKLSHTNETPFECNVCGKKFKCDVHLKAHLFRHKGIKNFSCDLCSKAFTTRPELKQHLRVHSNVKEFQCTFCNQLFKQKSQLSLHRRTHLFS